jgi:predicted ester cyclase
MNHDRHPPSRSTADFSDSRRAPRRVVFSCALVLALLTGAVLGQSRALLAPVAPVAGANDEATEAVARRFYDAVNAALGSGDLDTLSAIVTPDFADHTGSENGAGSREDLLDAVRRLAAERPVPRLTTLDLTATGPRVTARLQLDGGTPRDFLGLTVATGTAWSEIEILRVERGRVAERWRTPVGTTQLEPLADVAVDVHALGPRVVTLVRLTLSRGSRYRVPPTVLSAAYLESGTLVVPPDPQEPGPARTWRAGGTSEVVAAGDRAVLDAGDLLVPARHAAPTLVNDGGGVATVLLLTMVDAGAGDGRAANATVPPDGVTVTVLTGGVEVTPRFGEARLLIGRATLAAGTALGPHAASNPELISVETGSVRLTAAETGVSIRRKADETVEEADGAVLAAGDGALVPPGALVDLRAEGSGPTVMLVVRLVTEEPPTDETDPDEAPDETST